MPQADEECLPGKIARLPVTGFRNTGITIVTRRVRRDVDPHDYCG